ncbi:YbaN family protein [Roseateles sp. BYS96W]|uniref:YbaN family protein n=1 Tax=Pelomonas nitida TaxID=3299027 RepID=A0ABW7G532_9BURK
MRKILARWLWRALALASLVLAVLGVLLPILPTVPFLLLAAWAAGKGWPALEAWLLNHAHFGPGIRRWRESGAVPRRAKWLATGMMTLSATLLALSPAPLPVKIAVPAVMAAVAIWLWRRPEA